MEEIDSVDVAKSLDDRSKQKSFHLWSDFLDNGANKNSSLGHTPGSPWEMTTKMPNFKWAQEIGDGLINDYFSKIVRRSENA